MKQTVKIIFLCTAAVVLYGIAHNQITVRISLEYFTIGHREIIDSTSPTLLGIAWGIHPNWWVGLSLGTLFAIAGRAGKWPRRNAGFFIKPLLLLFLISGIAAAAAGITGYRLAGSGTLGLYEPLASAVPANGHAAYISALWMHTASYTVATMSSLIIALFVFTGRRRAVEGGKGDCPAV
ncbi:MAG: hypothetical protein KAR40_18170 [Candidatus Sabulitectum sp.]|nr:hypothetical protein [Candidatus Sabulitectum sp.]